MTSHDVEFLDNFPTSSVNLQFTVANFPPTISLDKGAGHDLLAGVKQTMLLNIKSGSAPVPKVDINICHS